MGEVSAVKGWKRLGVSVVLVGGLWMGSPAQASVGSIFGPGFGSSIQRLIEGLPRQAVQIALNLVQQQLGQLCRGNSSYCRALNTILAMLKPHIENQIRHGLLPVMHQATMEANQEIEQGSNERVAALVGQARQDNDSMTRGSMPLTPAALRRISEEEGRQRVQAALQATNTVVSGVQEMYRKYLEEQVNTEQLPEAYSREASAAMAEAERRAQAVEGADNELVAWQNLGPLLYEIAKAQKAGIETQLSSAEQLRGTLVWLDGERAKLKAAELYLLVKIMEQLERENQPKPAPAAGVESTFVLNPVKVAQQGR